jgi:pimeloyl-ACP methyl ester carboxylesterase
MFKKLSKPTKWLVSLLLVVLLASLAASLVQNSFFSVKVDKISFETERGELAGYLYTPRGVDEDNPVPAVILTHGYLNNSEMQEIGAIELSRRGYVVLAFDMYDHGDSVWETPAAFNFFVRSVYDAVQYMYEQDYVLKDSLGNAMIGVSGHSMGGFSSEYAVIFDEMDAAVNGYRKIAASLSVGADFRYIGVADPASYFGTRSSGVIAAHYDQFFFDNVTPGEDGSVRYKDFATDPVGLDFLGRTAEGTATAGTFYSRDGGQRVIYTPDETHPQNTWSLESGSNTIEFFEKSFEYQLDLYGLDSLESLDIKTGVTTQTWWLKEAFTLVGLIALFALTVPAFMLVTKLPIFNKVYANGVELVQEDVKLVSKEKKYLKGFIVIMSLLISFYFLKPLMDRSAELDNLATTMYYIIAGAVVIIIALWIAATISNGIDAKNNNMIKVAQKATLSAVIVIFIALAFRFLLTNTQLITNVNFWSAPSVNTIVYWAIGSAGLILLVVFGTTPMFNQGEVVDNPYGLKASLKQVGASILTALVLAFGLLFLVALVGWIFKTDFRFYTYAIQIFNSHQFVAALRYIPLFFIYYFAAGITVFVNTRNIKGWLGDVLAALLLAGPIIIFLVYQYSVLYNTGVAAYPTFSLSAILTVGLVPTLSVAGILMRRISQKTGNIWTGVIFSSVFFTLITLANTVVYLLTIG